MEYFRICTWCRKDFIAHRKDNIYCCAACKKNKFELTKGMSLISAFVPQKEARELAIELARQKKYGELFLHWFWMNGNRYADVYASENSSTEWEKKLRYLNGYNERIKKPL